MGGAPIVKKMAEIKSKVKSVNEAEKRIRPKKEPKVVQDVTLNYRLITREELDRAEREAEEAEM